jgi:hypothetical protein
MIVMAGDAGRGIPPVDVGAGCGQPEEPARGSRVAWAWARASSWAVRGRRKTDRDLFTLTPVAHAARFTLVATATAHAHAGRPFPRGERG